MTHRRDRSPPALSVRIIAPPWVSCMVVALAAGCMTSKVDETRQIASPIEANESIVLLKKPQLEGVGTEEVFLDCVQERLGGELVHPEAGQIRDSLVAPRDAVQDLWRAGIHGRLVPMVRAEHGARQHRRACACCCSAPASPSGCRKSASVTSSGWTAIPARPTAAAASPVPSAPAAAGVSASAGGKRNRATWLRSGTCSNATEIGSGQRRRHGNLRADRCNRADPDHHAGAQDRLRPAERPVAFVPGGRRPDAGRGSGGRRRRRRCGGRLQVRAEG